MKEFLQIVSSALEALTKKMDRFKFYEMFGFFPSGIGGLPPILARKIIEGRFCEIAHRIETERKVLMSGNPHLTTSRIVGYVREFDSAIELAQRFGYSSKLLDEYIEEIKTMERSDPSSKVRFIK